MHLSIDIGKKYSIRLNGRAGTIVIDSINNSGFTKQDYLNLAEKVPPFGCKGSDLKGRIKIPNTTTDGTCTFKGCTIVFASEQGIELKYDSMIYDFMPS